jgi:hypothetical protein
LFPGIIAFTRKWVMGRKAGNIFQHTLMCWRSQNGRWFWIFDLKRVFSSLAGRRSWRRTPWPWWIIWGGRKHMSLATLWVSPPWSAAHFNFGSLFLKCVIYRHWPCYSVQPGAMISCKLAAIAPHRLCSLALLNVTGGGFQCFPKVDGQMLSLAFRFLRAKTPEERALVDLETHYTKVRN